MASLAVFLGSSLPGGFIPTEDQGYMFLALQLPDSSSAQRTDAAEQRITDALLKTPGIEGVIAVTDFSLLTQVQSTNSGFFFVALKPWEMRKSKKEQLAYIQGNLQKAAVNGPRRDRLRLPAAVRFRGLAHRAASRWFSKIDRGSTIRPL